MNAWTILKRAKHIGAREFREKLKGVLSNQRDVFIVEKNNQPAHAMLPYPAFLDLLESFQEAQSRDPSQAWFWAPSWQERMKRSWKDVHRGRVKKFTTVDELIADLKG